MELKEVSEMMWRSPEPAESRASRRVEGIEGRGSRVYENGAVVRFRGAINEVIRRHEGCLSYAEAVGVLFGIATDLAREAREEANGKH